jgi:hypothetical protein
MRLTIDNGGTLAPALRSLGQAGKQTHMGWGRLAQRVGDSATRDIKVEFRSGPTSKTTTQVRHNQLRSADSPRVTIDKTGVRLDVGLLRPTASDETLLHGRMQEGINADGSRFTFKIIRPKRGRYLTFPIYDPTVPGVARSNIIGWARVEKVTFRPRPSFPTMMKRYTPVMRDGTREVVRHVLR